MKSVRKCTRQLALADWQIGRLADWWIGRLADWRIGGLAGLIGGIEEYREA